MLLLTVALIHTCQLLNVAAGERRWLTSQG